MQFVQPYSSRRTNFLPAISVRLVGIDCSLAFAVSFPSIGSSGSSFSSRHFISYPLKFSCQRNLPWISGFFRSASTYCLVVLSSPADRQISRRRSGFIWLKMTYFRLEWRWQLFSCQLSPIDLGEPRVPFDFAYSLDVSYAFLRVLDKK